MESKPPIISIIIPVYNVEKYISRCLDSILSQSFQDFEIILINDQTPDNSIKIAENYAANDARIRILHNEENSGAAWSRMTGYTNARGSYITFCDPDDYLPINALEILHEAISQDSSVDMCIGDYQRVFTDGTKSEVFVNKLAYGKDKWGIAKSTLIGKTPQFLWNKIYKAELFKHSNIITYKQFSKSSDEFLFFQILQHCNKIININKVVYYYFDNQDSASYNKSNINALSAMITSLKFVEKIYTDKEEFKSILHKWKLGKYVKFLSISKNDKQLLRLIFQNNIDYLFTPWNLYTNFHKSKALKVYLTYLKAKLYNFF